MPPPAGTGVGPKLGPPNWAAPRTDFGPDGELHIEHYWYDIDLETIEPYEFWKPASLRWAKKVNWAKLNELIRINLDQFPPDDVDIALASASADAGLGRRDLEGLNSLYAEPIFATPDQITSGGHRITAMRHQGLRWALGKCLPDDVGTPGIPELHVYLPR